MAVCWYESQETSRCSVQEAGSLRTRGTMMQHQSEAEGLESSWFKSTFKGWRTRSLSLWGKAIANNAPIKKSWVKVYTTPWCFCFVFHPGSQPIGPCCHIQGRSSPLSSSSMCQSILSGNALTGIPRRVLYQFSRHFSIQLSWWPRLTITSTIFIFSSAISPNLCWGWFTDVFFSHWWFPQIQPKFSSFLFFSTLLF
jgi:hypothetical protein